jgi:hypothetical protein
MVAMRGPVGFAAFAFAALAPAGARAEDPVPERENSVIVYGNDACPGPREPDEIVICARRPEEERYRIPPELRANRERRTETSWGTTAAALEGEQAYTRPGGCSPVGSFGQTGCQQQFMNQWLAERAAAARRRR